MICQTGLCVLVFQQPVYVGLQALWLRRLWRRCLQCWSASASALLGTHHTSWHDCMCCAGLCGAVLHHAVPCCALLCPACTMFLTCCYCTLPPRSCCNSSSSHTHLGLFVSLHTAALPFLLSAVFQSETWVLSLQASTPTQR